MKESFRAADVEITNWFLTSVCSLRDAISKLTLSTCAGRFLGVLVDWIEGGQPKRSTYGHARGTDEGEILVKSLSCERLATPLTQKSIHELS